MQTPKLIILGRDGILNRFREDHVKEPSEWEPIPGALEAVAKLNHAGWTRASTTPSAFFRMLPTRLFAAASEAASGSAANARTAASRALTSARRIGRSDSTASTSCAL